MDSTTDHLDLSRYPTRPTRLLSAGGGWASLDLGELWSARELFVSLAWRDVRTLYKQTALGVVWVVLQPLFGAGIFSFIFAMVAGLEAPDGLPYFLFTFAGLVAWKGFSSVVSRSSSSLVGNAAMVSKVYFPRLVLPIASTLSVLVDFLVALTLLAVLVPTFWSVPGWSLLLLPVVTAVLWAMGLGIGLIASAISVRYRDALHVLPVLLQFAMWGSAVMFPIREVPERFVDLLYLNPLVSLIEAFRWSVLGAGEVRWGFVAYSSAISAVVLLVGAIAFRRMERRFADVI